MYHVSARSPLSLNVRLKEPWALTYGPDDHLYVYSHTAHEVLGYHGRTGKFLGAAVVRGAQRLAVPTDLNLFFVEQ
jgi:hypothetical protein